MRIYFTDFDQYMYFFLQDHVYQFCCKDCCEDYKRLHGVVSQCEYCKQEKILHEKIRFSGVEKNFCSEGK